MDSVIFQAMAAELNRLLAGSRIDRVIQVAAGSLILRLWTGRERRQLLLRADAHGCFYLTGQAFGAPAVPPRFCQLLRARLRRLYEVRAEPRDRVVHFFCAGPDGDHYDLVLELLGQQGNLILVDADGKIVDLLWRQEGSRTLQPGQIYQLPEPMVRLSLLDESDAVAQLPLQEDPAGCLQQQVFPMSPALAQALAAELQTGRAISELIDELRSRFANADFKAQRVAWGQRGGYLPLAVGLQVFDAIEDYADLSVMLETGQSAREQGGSEGLAPRLRDLLKRQKQKLKKRLKYIEKDRQRYADPTGFRVSGELLLANLYRIKRGMSEVEVDDYYHDPPVSRIITLDPVLTPQENAERSFKLYRKAKRAGEHHSRRLQETAQEMAWLEQVELSLDDANSPDDLYQVQLEMEAAGLLKTTKGQLGKRPTTSPAEQIRKLTSPGGWPLCWGKNNRTNDYVSRELTGSKDLWMHAHNLPGCHLVLKTDGKPEQVPEEDVLFAAALAAGYSKAQDAGKVEVMVAAGKAVRKPKGAKPGLVTVENYRTVMVVPRRLEEDDG